MAMTRVVEGERVQSTERAEELAHVYNRARLILNDHGDPGAAHEAAMEIVRLVARREGY